MAVFPILFLQRNKECQPGLNEKERLASVYEKKKVSEAVMDSACSEFVGINGIRNQLL